MHFEMAKSSPSGALSLPEFAMRRSFNYTRVKKVQEELLCAICLDFLEEPKLLQCAHSFCRKCLVDLVVLPEVEGAQDHEVVEGRVQCPSCREYSSLLGGNVDALKTNFRLKNVIEIVSTEDRAEQRKALQVRMNPSSIQTWQLPVCAQHAKPQEYYCSECKELLCRRCMMAAHRSHDYDEADLVLGNRVAALRSLIQPAWEAAARAEDLENEVTTQRDSIAANSGEVKAEAKAFFEQVRRLLEERETEVTRTIETYASSKLDKLTAWEASLTEARSRIVDTVAEIDTLVECTGDVSIIPKTHAIVEALNAHQKSILTISDALAHHGRSSTRSLLSFDTRQSLEEPIRKLGILRSDTDSSDDESGSIAASGGRHSLKGCTEEPPTLTQEVKSPEPSFKSPEPPAEQVSVPASCGPSARPVARQLVPSCSTPNLYQNYEPVSRHLAMTLPTRRGRPDAIRCRVPSEPVIPADEEVLPRPRPLSEIPFPTDAFGSPTPASSISSLVESIEEYFPHVLPPILVYPQSPGGFATEFQPVGVTIGQGNAIIVCDTNKSVLKVIAASGRLIDTIGSEGKEKGQFRKPSAVAVNSEGSIFIADNGNSRIQKFSSGKFSSRFWHKTRSSSIGDLWGIAVSTDGKIVYASDWQSHCIHAFDQHGKHINCLGTDFLQLPVGIAINAFGNILVADRDHHCVWVLSAKGQMLRQIGHKGKGPGDLYKPHGIAVHPDGLILIAESGNSRVSVFSQTGEFITCFGDHGAEPGQFNQPKHICVNARGHVVVADELNHRVQVFDISPLISEIESTLL